jgi:hypothetical protein
MTKILVVYYSFDGQRGPVPPEMRNPTETRGGRLGDPEEMLAGGFEP